MRKRLAQNNAKAIAVIQIVFLVLSITLSLFWLQELFRANQPLLPFLVLICVGIVTGLFVFHAIHRRFAVKQLCYAYMGMDFLLLALLIYLLPQPQINLLPSVYPLTALIADFSLNRLYWFIFDILAVLHIVTFVFGAYAIRAITRMNRQA